MSLFSLESLAPWVLMLLQPTPTRILSGFILWSILELPMYGFELLGLLSPTDAPVSVRLPPKVPTFLLLWLAALGVAYAICYAFLDATPMTRYPKTIWAVAFLFIPLPPVIAARHFIRRGLRHQGVQARSRSAAG